MSILIKGMEMPKNGFITVTVTFDGRVVGNAKKENGKYEDLDNEDIAKAVPVPPHGRLIDVDYADEYAYDELELANNYLTGWEAARAMQKIYQNAPTVIEAEEGDG